MEFSSPEALKQYLQDHPNADRSKHFVKKDEDSTGKDEEKGKGKRGPAKPKALFSPKEIESLPDSAVQKTSDPEKLFEAAKDAHEHQLNWLNHGKGLDKAVGARVLRIDKGEDFDLSKPGPVIVIGPVKSRARVEEKAKSDYGGDYGEVRDIVRASVAVDSMDQLDDVMKKLKESGLKLAKKPTDRFAKPTEAGYRDLMMNVVYPNGHIGELQLHLKGVLKAKDAGHKYYEEVRTIEGKAKREGRTTMTDEELKTVNEANAKMKKLYDDAWAEATGSGSDSGPDRTKNAGDRQALDSRSKYYDFDGSPCRWEGKKFPVRVTKKGEKVIYELEKFFQNAASISQADYKAMVEDLSSKGKN
jgi:hypothetical protein